MPSLPRLDPAVLRRHIVGADTVIRTPYGERLMVYGDYTASGRCLDFVEHYLMHLQRNYANTHTEDDITGRSMTHLLREAERVIKDAVNAGSHGRIIATGSGSTAAIDKFQQLVGVMIPPATRDLLGGLLSSLFGVGGEARLRDLLSTRQPVVLVGPYEHHSNEVSWRQGLATVREVGLDDGGDIDLAHLAKLLRAPDLAGRLVIGSFSAASNVTGRISPVREIAVLLHRHGALACFDYAASGPYVAIDMNPAPAAPGEDASLDAVFLSPHKFLGGPGSAGILVFNERIYRRDLPPSVAGGGTVSYVSPRAHDFVVDIEERERAGTPAVLQTMKAALAFLVKEAVGVARIEARERELLERALARWRANPAIDVLGHPDPARQIGIVSFNVRRPGGRYLHPRLVTVLLNDLFGVQSRAGCSCAGPYGHLLLGIDDDTSERFRRCILDGWQGIKPGWCRVGFHYTMDDPEAEFLMDAVDFVARRGHDFLGDYHFDPRSSAWTHGADDGALESFSLDKALGCGCPDQRSLDAGLRRRLYRDQLAEAEALADERMRHPVPLAELEGEAGRLQFFDMPHGGA
ncbi:MAG: aminotransferase class V-fold PLP-dependent enzyme [bacterium]|nr:aminotransferase class V-fold PLP-dependent enzyme [bacterium]